MAIFSKKHYGAIASSFAEIQVPTDPIEGFRTGIEACIRCLATLFAANNPAFDSGQFFRRIAEPSESLR